MANVDGADYLAGHPAFAARESHRAVVVQLSFSPRLMAFVFNVGLRQHLQFLHGTPNRWLLERRRQCFRIYLFRKLQN